MTRVVRISILLATLACAPACAFAISAVFAGDPVDPSGLPYEILPGFPLYQPGPDGVFGTADDSVDPSVVGDIDMVVRSGSPAATSTIPEPAAVAGRSGLPVGIAGSRAAGGSEIPFTVFLSDGAVGSDAPSGHLLTAADMGGIPVVVAAFADLDQDGFVGPTDQDRSRGSDDDIEVRELEPVGRAVALFGGGVARGSVAIRAGLPASQGGLAVALTGLALTGPFNPSFFGGNIPSGPGISTAQPFLLQRDLTKLIRDRAAAVGPTTTLQQVLQFAALPSPSDATAFALPLDGSVPTIDVALVNSQAPASAAFREDLPQSAARQTITDVELGTRSPGSGRRLRLMPVDRWGNPADPDSDFSVTLQVTGPLRIVRPSAARGGRAVSLRSAEGVRVTVKVPPGTASGTHGTLTAERNGGVVAALSYRTDSQADRPRADISVPSARAPSIQAAIDNVVDRNNDGVLVIDISRGLYRENLSVHRSVVVRGDLEGSTLVQGDGSASVLAVTAPNATIRGLTAVGGTQGFALSGANALLADSAAWRNLGAGVSVSGTGVQVSGGTAVDNGGDGLLITGASSASCSGTTLTDNRGAGANLSGAQNAQLENNLIADNAGAGVSLVSVDASTVTDNQIANNLGSGIELFSSQDNQIAGNLSALSDEDGLHIDSTSSNLISDNVFDTNHGYGMYVRRSSSDDFAAATGVQAPPGDNSSTNSRKGDVFVRTE